MTLTQGVYLSVSNAPLMVPACSRRTLLQACTGLSFVGLAGCLDQPTPPGSPTNTPQFSPTQRTENLQTKIDAINFEARVTRQESSDHPARVDARLENTGPDSIDVGMGPTLLFSDPGPDDVFARPEALVIDPNSDIGPWDEPLQSEDGCWRFPKDGQQAIRSIERTPSLSPGDAITETYTVYTHGESRACLPAGTYRFTDQGFITNESNPIVLTLLLKINENNLITASTDGPSLRSN